MITLHRHRKFSDQIASPDPRDWTIPLLTSDRSIRNQDTMISLREYIAPILDQESKPYCVGYSGVYVLRGSGDWAGEDLNPDVLYRLAQLHDEKEGEDYPGTSVSGACKALISTGINGKRIHAYYKLNFKKNLPDILNLLRYEPLWVSIVARKALFMPPIHGFDRQSYLETPIVGYHAMAITGYIIQEDVVYFEVANSWGEAWGDKGFCYMPLDLLSEISQPFGNGDCYYLVTMKERAAQLARLKSDQAREPWYKKIKMWLKKLF